VGQDVSVPSGENRSGQMSLAIIILRTKPKRSQWALELRAATNDNVIFCQKQ